MVAVAGLCRYLRADLAQRRGVLALGLEVPPSLRGGMTHYT
jgi:hypothetical protein